MSSGSTPVVAEREWESLARAAVIAAGEESELLRELLAFRLSTAAYAIPVERVREIVRLRRVTPVPRVPRSVIGVIALRGEIVQVVDLRQRLGLETREPSRTSRVIVLHGDDDRVTGVLVDEVREVLRVTEEAIQPAPSGDSGRVAELCVKGDEFVSVIDLDRVLDLDDER